jgi:ABC-type uncharacterized transport system substrate-binding protein
MKKIGFLVSATQKIWHKYLTAFRDELKKKGWTEGVDVLIDFEPRQDKDGNPIDGAAGDLDLINKAAVLFADPTNNYNVIVTAGTEAAQACQRETNKTNKLSIVFASVGDPVACGLVKNLKHPTGTNLTGCSNMQTDPRFTDKRIVKAQNLKTDVNKKIGVVGNDNPTVCPIESTLKLVPMRVAAIPIKLQPSDFKSLQNIQAALAQYQNQLDVLLVCSDPLLSANVDDFIQAAHNLKMKTVHEFEEPKVDHGGDDASGQVSRNCSARLLTWQTKYSAARLQATSTFISLNFPRKFEGKGSR